MSSRSDLKRYNLVLPTDLFEQVERIADEEHATVVDVLRRFVKLGLLASRIERTPEAALLIREGGTEREIIFL